MLDPRLQYLVLVARAGSFTGGAAAIGITQSAVTKSIADLEREVGYPIFNRTARGVVLTERGSYFAERAAMLLDDTRELMDPESRRANAYSGILRIGVAPASLEWTIVESLSRLRRQHPEIRFDVTGSNFDRTIQQLRSGALDVAIGLNEALLDWPDIEASVFGALDGVPFVRREHPLTTKTELQIDDLADFDFISPSISRPYGELIRGIYTSRGVPWQRRVHAIDYFPSVKHLVATSDAIGVVSTAFSAQPGFAREFVSLGQLNLFPSMPLSCAVRQQWEPKPATRAFIAMMKAVHGARARQSPPE